MPIYRFKCPECQLKRSKLMTPEESKEPFLCECGIEMERDFGKNDAIVKETIDNGVMPKRIEQFANSAELLQERNDRSDEDKDKKTL